MLKDLFRLYWEWAGEGVQYTNIYKAIKYLYKFGYLAKHDLLDSTKDARAKLEIIVEAIKRLQAFAGLVTDGVVGPKTVQLIETPRCGLPDYISDQIEFQTWGIKRLTYHILNADSDLPRDVWHNTIHLALMQWSEVADISFEPTNDYNKANLVFDIGRGSGDNFDGPGGVLAWAQLPPRNGFRGRLLCKFDADERWITRPGNGILLLNVACHEAGHLLGLRHSNINTALMAPFYSPRVSKPQEEDDITRIQKKYGKPKNNTPNPPPTPTPQPPQSPNKLVINITGNIQSIDIPGYRVFKVD